MSIAALPPAAAWQHQQAREGFEVAFFEQHDDGYHVYGTTAAIEAGQTWAVDYEIELSASWTTRRAQIAGRSVAGARHLLLEADGVGHWRINGEPAPHLNGCLDVDLESSAVTNALPVHRMTLDVGQQATAPAAFVRAIGLDVERLEQSYLRLAADEAGRQRYHYTAPVFGFACRLDYDDAGLVLSYPGIAVRTG